MFVTNRRHPLNATADESHDSQAHVVEPSHSPVSAAHCVHGRWDLVGGRGGSGAFVVGRSTKMGSATGVKVGGQAVLIPLRYVPLIFGVQIDISCKGWAGEAEVRVCLSVEAF